MSIFCQILSKEEVYGAEKHQKMQRQDTFDDSCLPELIGPSVLIKPEYLRTVSLWSCFIFYI